MVNSRKTSLALSGRMSGCRWYRWFTPRQTIPGLLTGGLIWEGLVVCIASNSQDNLLSFGGGGKRWYLSVTILGRSGVFLVDTGASHSMISRDIFRSLAVTSNIPIGTGWVSADDGSEIQTHDFFIYKKLKKYTFGRWWPSWIFRKFKIAQSSALNF